MLTGVGIDLGGVDSLAPRPRCPPPASTATARYQFEGTVPGPDGPLEVLVTGGAANVGCYI